MAKQKQNLNLLILGNNNVGKSTLINYFVDNTSKNLLEKLKGDYERQDDIDQSIYYFETKTKRFNLIDVPGHNYFMKNLIIRSLIIDCVLLVISIEQNSNDILHWIQLISILSIKQIIIILKKIDLIHSTDLQQIKFNEINNLIETIQYNPTNLTIIPISSIPNEKDLLRICNSFDLMNKSIDEYSHKALRLPLNDIYKIGGIGPVPVGQVLTGIFKANMIIKLTPSDQIAKVKSIEMPGNINEAYPGDYIGFHLEKINFNDLKRGFICSDIRNDPARETLNFFAYIVIIDDSIKLNVNLELTLYCHTACVQCKIIEIKSKLNRRTGKLIETNPKELKTKQIGFIRINLLNRICIETFADYPPLGRFMIRQMNKTLAVGLVTQVEKKTN